MKKYAFAEAVKQYTRALEWIPQVKVIPEKRLDLYVRHGRALELNGQYAEALEHYQTMETLAQSQGDRALELAALTAQGTIFVTANTLSDIPRGEQLCQKALELAQTLGEEATEAKIQWNLLNVYRMTGHIDQALAAGERFLALAEKVGMREQLAYTTNDLGYVYQAVADIENMNRVLEIAIPIWRELGNLPMLTDSLTSYANYKVFFGELEQALAFSQETQAISQSLNNPWSQTFTLFTPCFVHWFRMEVSQALESMNRCISLAREVGFVGGIVNMSNYQAQLLLDLGQVEMAQKVMQGIREMAERNIPLFLPGSSSADVMIALNKGDMDGAAKILEPFSLNEPLFDLMNSFTVEYTACEYHLRTGAVTRINSFAERVAAFLRSRYLVTFLPQFLYYQAQAQHALGETEAAWDNLQDALTLCNANDIRWKKRQILTLLAEIADLRNQQDVANQYQKQERKTIAWIADQIDSDELKRTFILK